jgi:hypothetical protein
MPLKNIDRIKKNDEVKKVADELAKIARMPQLKDLTSKIVLAEITTKIFDEVVNKCEYVSGEQEPIFEKVEIVRVFYIGPNGFGEYETKKYNDGSYDASKGMLQNRYFKDIITNYNITIQEVEALSSRLEN